MRHAISIFSYGFTQLFHNFSTALRLTGLIWVITSIAIYALGHFMIGQSVGVMGVRPGSEGQMPDLSATFIMLALVINLLAISWATLLWSRFCLGADTPPGILASLKGTPFGGHLLTLILVIASVGACSVAVSFLGTLILPVIPMFVGLFVLPAVTVWLAFWLVLRLGAAIPGAAAGQIMSLAHAWVGSRGKGLWLVASMAFITAVLSTLPGMFLFGQPILGNIASLITSWVFMIIGTGWLVAIFKLIPPVSK